LPIALSALSSVAIVFSKVNVPSPFPLLTLLVFLGAAAVVAIFIIATLQSKRRVYSGKPVLSLSEMAPVEAYGRLLPKDLLNAFARFIGSSRALSLDDRVYAFSETHGQGHEGEPSDHAEYIAESAPLLRTNLLPDGLVRSMLIAMGVIGEILILVSAFVLFNAMAGYVELVRQSVAALFVGNFARLMILLGHPLTISALFVVLFARFGGLFREIGLCFLGEVVFESFMVSISISSSILPGRREVVEYPSDGQHFFDAGRTSIMRIRILTARVQTSTMVSRGGGSDSLGAARYIIAAEREDRLMNALGQVAYKYIEERTSAAATMVRSAAVESKDAAHLLVDSSSRGSLGGSDKKALFGPYQLDGNQIESDRRRIDESE
jgi:hypothetical protein